MHLLPLTVSQIASEVEEAERALARPVKRSSLVSECGLTPHRGERLSITTLVLQSARINRSSTEEEIVREQRRYGE